MIYLADADSTMPNLALMRLSTHFRARGHAVQLIRPAHRRMPLFDSPGPAFGSSLFRFSAPARAAMEREWGPITWGGTGVDVASSLDTVDAAVNWDHVPLDYTLYPQFAASIGFLTRGCRLRCGFCVVPAKEGKPRAVATVRDVWRGEPHPRHLHLLDNDAFSPTLRSHWSDAVRALREGKFRVCFSQGINLRLVDDEAASAIASVHYTGHDFDKRRLYTAWDALGDEAIFRRGVVTLARHGVPASHLRVYMLVGYDPQETWEAVFYRYQELRALGCDPFPMVFDKATRPDLAAFARWALGILHGSVPWPEWRPCRDGRREPRLTPEACAASDAAWARVVVGWKPPHRMKVVA